VSKNRVLFCNADPDWDFVSLARSRLVFLWPRDRVAIWDLCAPGDRQGELWPDLPRPVPLDHLTLALAGFLAAGKEPVKVLMHLGEAGVSGSSQLSMASLHRAMNEAVRAVNAGNRFSVLFSCRNWRFVPGRMEGAQLLLLSDPLGFSPDHAVAMAHRADLLAAAVLLMEKDALLQPSHRPEAWIMSADNLIERPWMPAWHGIVGDLASGLELLRHASTPEEILNGPLRLLSQELDLIVRQSRRTALSVDRVNSFADEGAWLLPIRMRWWRRQVLPDDFASRAATLWSRLKVVDGVERRAALELLVTGRRLAWARLRMILPEIEKVRTSQLPVIPSVPQALRRLAGQCRIGAASNLPESQTWDEAAGATHRENFERTVRRTVRSAIWWPTRMPVPIGIALAAIVPIFFVAFATYWFHSLGQDDIPKLADLFTPVAVWMAAGGVVGAAKFLARRRKVTANALGRTVIRFHHMADWFQDRLVAEIWAMWRGMDRHGFDLMERRLNRAAEDREKEVALAVHLALWSDSVIAGNGAAFPDAMRLPEQHPSKWLPSAAAVLFSGRETAETVVIADRQLSRFRSVSLNVPLGLRTIDLRRR
jgi:hypothetical protein